MPMSWITEAEARGAVEASQRQFMQEQKARFDAEPEFAVEKATEFLTPFETVLKEGLIADIEKAGYQVKTKGPEYLHHSYDQESKREKRDKYTLKKTEPSYGWGMTDYTRQEHKIFGTEYEITRGETRIGTIGLYPVVSKISHLGGVEYATIPESFFRGTNYSGTIANPEEFIKIVTDLRGAVANLIAGSIK